MVNVVGLSVGNFLVLGHNPPDSLRNVYETILKTYPQELEQARQQANPQLEIGTLIKGAAAYQYLGEFDKAIALYQEALPLARKIADRGLEGSVIFNLSVIYSKQGDPYGIDFLESELARVTELGSREVILKYLSLAYTQSGNYEKVIVLKQEQLKILEKIGAIAEQAAVLNELGLAYYSLKEYYQAIELQEQALELLKPNNSPILMGTILTYLVINYQLIGAEAKVLEKLEDLLALGKATENLAQMERALEMMAEYAALQGNTPQAIALAEERLAIARQSGVFSDSVIALQDLSKLYYWAGNLEQAIALQKQSVTLLDQNIYQQQQQTPEVFESLEFTRITSQSYAQENLGFLHLQAKNFQEARSSFEKAIQGFDALRQKSLKNKNFTALTADQIKIFTYDQATDIYRLLQQISVQENQPLKALELSEAGRARALVDLLVSKLATDPNSILTTPPPNLDTIRQIARRENTTLVTYTIQYQYGRLYQTGPKEWLQSPSEKRIATELYIWVIQPNGNITFRSIPLNLNLDELVAKARNFILVPGPSRRRLPPGNPLQDLHHYLIEPIADLLPQNPEQRVTFIPQDSLLLVPFAALQNPQGQYLIEQHTILISPSIQVLELTRQNRQRHHQHSSPPPALVVGNPTMPKIELEGGRVTTQLEDLPGSEAEAQAIAALLHTQPLIGEAATKSAVVTKMQSSRIIHLATHGLLDGAGGLLSSLALAPTHSDRGFLTAKEITQLSLPAELAVLSACDTGRGIINGDGVIGLSRAFVSAGVAGVLVSLWAIPDQSTVTVMTGFYQQMQQGKDKANALRQAMLNTRQQFPEPLHWSAFTFIGVPE